ncbi:MAG: GtrA family protein [Sphingomonadales bacterium]|nr:GtrA family protein [Sphingomonadales bacterium]PIX66451.1 MAG: polysaccharide biosynthesis protein GtrA [Sphingomonadales bacterium CG_4_10_14_3_um_filter_58_15]NCO48694.1 GtrA family protein [Sphingomonadales bacterium]NCP00112.1 GtrA family protein [Sphingomonadales bacterium]NCP27896.1 GtrA family protein [Sphingomonadales bacterium]
MERSGTDRRSLFGGWVGNLPTPLALLHRFSITRYLLASIVSLAFDVSLFMVLVAFLVDPGWASALGYSVGIVVHWLISSSFVFPGKSRQGGALQLQRLGFVGTAILGLGITVAMVSWLTELQFSPVVAKGSAVFVSFFVVYLTRKFGVFR